jgi:hypothetical protein
VSVDEVVVGLKFSAGLSAGLFGESCVWPAFESAAFGPVKAFMSCSVAARVKASPSCGAWVKTFVGF